MPGERLSSSPKSSAPISEHSRLHKLTPLRTILRTYPRCVETKVMGLKIELDCTEPCPPWSTCPASPIRDWGISNPGLPGYRRYYRDSENRGSSVLKPGINKTGTPGLQIRHYIIAYLAYIEWYHVWLPSLTSKRAVRVCRHQLSFCFCF